MPEPVYIFLHGFMGRAETRVAWLTFEYFRGLREVAAKLGVRLEVPQMPSRTGVDDRALAVRPLLAQAVGAPVVLVGNSMGGLVARTLAAKYDSNKQIRVVATLCTPHHGSPLADRALAGETRVPEIIVDLVADAVGDLTVARAQAFNTETPDRPDVAYLSWAATRPAEDMPVWFKKREAYIREREGPNDGLVSVKSATWGDLVDVERADHTECFGWTPATAAKEIARPFDQKDLWRRIIERTRLAV